MATMLVSGATGGLGSVVVQRAKDAGWNVIGLSYSDGDLSSEHVVEQIVRELPKDLSAVIHLVGGIRAGTSIDETVLSDFQEMLSVNLISTFNIFHATMPLLRKNGGGSVLTVGAQSVLHPIANLAAYTASKAAVVALTMALAEEGKQFGVRANCVVPSTIRTEANLSWASTDQAAEFVTPEEIADTMMHLSSASCGVSGAVIPMFGKIPY